MGEAAWIEREGIDAASHSSARKEENPGTWEK